MAAYRTLVMSEAVRLRGALLGIKIGSTVSTDSYLEQDTMLQHDLCFMRSAIKVKAVMNWFVLSDSC